MLHPRHPVGEFALPQRRQALVAVSLFAVAGMDGAVYGTRRDPFDVLLVARDGSTQVFSSHHRKPAA